MYIKIYNYSLNQSITIMQCTSYPFQNSSKLETAFLAEVKCLYYATNSYLHWYDEYRCEEDYDCIRKMNTAIMQMRNALNKLEPFIG